MSIYFSCGGQRYLLVVESYGAIDVGTNSVRLLIASLENGSLITQEFALESTRIGEGVESTRFLHPGGKERTLEVLHRYRLLLESWRVKQARAVATSAVREARDGKEFALQAGRVLGFPLEIISGEEEAYLSFLGVAQALPGIAHPLVMDIGGGSTELVWEEAGGIRVYSLPVGAVRWTENPAARGIMKEWEWLFEHLRKRVELILIGLGGTVTSLAAIDQGLTVYRPELVHGYRMSRKKVKYWEDYLASLSLEERRQVPGLQPARADIIVAGVQILREIMERSERQEVIAAESDLLHGLVWSMVEADSKPGLVIKKQMGMGQKDA